MTNKIWKLPKRETELWIEALRSGEYKQGISYLYNKPDDSYCCLGVWCQIHYPEYKERWIDGSFIELENVNVPDQLFGGHHNLASVLAYLNDGNMEAADANFKQYDIQIDLTKRYSFKEIADFIEKYVEYV